MAEIKIKKKAPIWPWILGILILAAIIYFLVFANDGTDDMDDVDDTVTTTEQVVEKDTVNQTMSDTIHLRDAKDINAYTTFISDPNMTVDHEFSSAALTKLIAATKETADELDINIDADLNAANKLSNEITNDPQSLSHANKIKDAAGNITNALKTIQTEKFPQLDSQLEAVNDAVSNIKVDTPTLDQKNDVKAFFTKAGDLLTSIQNNYGQEK
ncbi:hypothetical protein ACFQ3R_12230 [Mesonia ostreae]|uniref:Immunodominant membrane protein n=1 Tax=Mesonia ostreae TaxID=861110 RepID=A0ABU2KIJ3_9FLAO|nr:hypothetical protein [Mesonia ostreae]MDT0294535.1 hypothetical protein [Mesonia ostreae]